MVMAAPAVVLPPAGNGKENPGRRPGKTVLVVR
jgi:hypothetical protein